MDLSKRKNMTLIAAIVGGSGVVSLGGLGIAAQRELPTPDIAAGSSVNAVTTTPSTVPPIISAEPLMKGPAPLPAEEVKPAAP